MPRGEVKNAQNKINQEMFEKLCAIQCTEEEIWSVMGVSKQTLKRWCINTYGMDFKEIYKIKRLPGRVSLRRTQFKLAEKNPAMAIFLGKQYLGQTDKVEEAHSFNNGILNDLVGALKDGEEDTDTVIESETD